MSTITAKSIFAFDQLARLLRGNRSDAICPACAHMRKAINRRKPTLRLWRLRDELISYNCIHCQESGYAWAAQQNGDDGGSEARRRKRAEEQRRRDEIERQAEEKRIAFARHVWRESLDPRGTWVEEYLGSRGLFLPTDPEILLRTLRFHPHCPWDRDTAPALLCAFTPIEANPFLDPPPVAIHRIRGRGHGNKMMLGPVKGCAVMISPWWHVHEHLHVCEGVETALRLYGEGASSGDDDPDAWQFDGAGHRPIWALGSAGALETFPVIERVNHLHIWADHDESRRGLEAGAICAARWQHAGKTVTIRYRNEIGADYGDPR